MVDVLRPILRATGLSVCLVMATSAQTATNARLVELVTRMAKIGRTGSPSFSPDGARLAQSFAVAEKYPAGHLPVSAFDQHDNRMSIPIEIADAGVGGGLRDGLQGTTANERRLPALNDFAVDWSPAFARVSA